MCDRMPCSIDTQSLSDLQSTNSSSVGGWTLALNPLLHKLAMASSWQLLVAVACCVSVNAHLQGTALHTKLSEAFYTASHHLLCCSMRVRCNKAHILGMLQAGGGSSSAVQLLRSTNAPLSEVCVKQQIFWACHRLLWHRPKHASHAPGICALTIHARCCAAHTPRYHS
jgi:hypothetical protein